MSKKIFNYKEFIKENAAAEPAIKPAPTTTPTRRSRPSPIPGKRPQVAPKPKAETEDVINKFLSVGTEEDKKEVLDKYEEA